MVIVPVSYGIAYVVFIFMLLTASTLCGVAQLVKRVYLLNGFDVKWFLLVFLPK